MARKVRATHCGKCSGDMIADQDYDLETRAYKATWACNNCNNVEPRKVYKTGTDMTPSQKAAIEKFKADYFQYHSYGHPENYEISRFDVKLIPETGEVMVAIEVKYNKPGTVGALFPSYAYVFIKRGGGMYSYAPGAKVNRKGLSVRIYGRDLIYQNGRA